VPDTNHGFYNVTFQQFNLYRIRGLFQKQCEDEKPHQFGKHDEHDNEDSIIILLY